MKFANLGADFKLVACLGLLAAIASLAVGIVAAGQAAIEGQLERTLAASAADARSVADLYEIRAIESRPAGARLAGSIAEPQ